VTSGSPSLIVDLDGTLVDSAPLIAGIIDTMLVERGSDRRVAAADARDYLTRGGAQLVTALLGSEPADLAADLAEFRARYAALQTPVGCLFPGVVEGLTALSAQGVRMAICSNKPQHLCEKIIADLALERHFEATVGSIDGVALKPAPDLALRALKQLSGTPQNCLYVGDSDVDCKTARNAGIEFLFVNYGYAEPGVTIRSARQFDRFDHIVPFVTGWRGPSATWAVA
jgi:phosphoglycolate phosphatase